jgi:tRNA (guanine37-N1)-methyltransferase
LRFDIITLFPSFYTSPLSVSLLGKAIEKNLIEVALHNLRESGTGAHKQVDDRPFGGGPGMVLKPDVLSRCLRLVLAQVGKSAHVILLDPAGKVFDQKKADSLAKKKNIVLICGHYEGVDERFKEQHVSEEISVGDYILSGGEAASLIILESISRLIPGFLGKEESIITESFSSAKVDGKNQKLLDYPVYTRPLAFEGKSVPKILLSGNHAEIENWRLEKRIEGTKKRRPDLLV